MKAKIALKNGSTRTIDNVLSVTTANGRTAIVYLDIMEELTTSTYCDDVAIVITAE